MTADLAERAPVWPSWLVPPAAVDAWLSLMAALEAMTGSPPCVLEPDLWFASRTSPRLAEAVADCQQCPVLHLCAAYAVAADEREGVWGGLTAAERRALGGGS